MACFADDRSTMAACRGLSGCATTNQRNETMKQMSTGFGLAVLGACVLGAAFIASPRFGQQAFAQVTGERRIVSASVICSGRLDNNLMMNWGYRIWSDNSIELKCLSSTSIFNYAGGTSISTYPIGEGSAYKEWTQVDNGLTTFVPADVDANQSVDAADLGSVLSRYGETQEGNPPPPIDCTINAPR